MKKPTKEVSKELSEHLSKLGRKGAQARTDALTPKQRTAIAKRAALARWAAKEKP